MRGASMQVREVSAGLLGIQQDDAASAICPQLTYRQRLYGFGICFGIGFLIEICSFGMLTALFTGRAGRYAFMYTLGNVVGLSGTFFLCGPRRQCQRMKSERRWIVSVVFVSSMVLTLTMAVIGGFPLRGLLIFVCVLVQWCALAWYTLSFIPFGRAGARRLLRRCLGSVEDGDTGG